MFGEAFQYPALFMRLKIVIILLLGKIIISKRFKTCKSQKNHLFLIA